MLAGERGEVRAELVVDALEQLAREIVRGTARVVEANKESLIDRAWNAIMSTLKQFSAKPALVEGKPA